jgi:predicted Ser/Thr protein kinase/tetratricopeptide (TPR) repeat protein
MALGMLGKYERLDVLGHGASGIVYLAKDTLLGKLVALKEVSAQGEERERFLEEARVLDRLHHPNIVQVNGVDLINSKVIIDMEYVRGRNLQDVLRKRPQLPVADALDIAAQICEGLGYAHANRTVHRDVKPANIIISHEGKVKLVDFGLAEVLGTNSFAGGAGTYAYMAPEDFDAEGQSNRQSDIWAAGVILYEMLAGQRPFRVQNPKDPFAWKRAVETELLEPVSAHRSDVLPGIDEIVAKALARSRSERYDDATVMAADLRRLIPNESDLTIADLAVSSDPIYVAEPVEDDRTVAAPNAAAMPNPAAINAGVLLLAGCPPIQDIDSFLRYAPDQWTAARTAFRSGALSAWLRSIGEFPLAEVAQQLLVEMTTEHTGEDELLRDFLYRAGLDTMDEARLSHQSGVRAADERRYDAAIPLLQRAVNLDPTRANYHHRLAAALRDSGDREAARVALETGLAHHPGERGLGRDYSELTGASMALSTRVVDFGTLRKGETRANKITLRNNGTGAIQGRVASAPGWVRVEPASFATRHKQPLTITADSGGVWQAPAMFDETVVLETSAGREEIGVRLQVLPARRGFWQIFYWYLPILGAASLPLTAGALRHFINSGGGGAHLWQTGAIDSGLLFGCLFLLSVAADTVITWRILPLLLLVLNVAGAAGILQGMNSHADRLAQLALLRTSPIVLLALVLQSVAFGLAPRTWGRWQAWAVVCLGVSVLAASTIFQISL